MSTEEAKKRSIPEASIDTKLVFARLKKASQGEVIFYEEIAKIIHCDPQIGRGYSVVSSARRMALNEEGMVFEAVQNVGVKRLNDSEIAQYGSVAIRKIRKAVKVSAKKIASVRNFDGLSKEDKVAHNASLSMLGAIAQSVTPKNVKRIEGAVATASAAIPTAETLKLFGGG